MIRLSALRKTVHFRDTNGKFRTAKGLGGGRPPSKSVSWILRDPRLRGDDIEGRKKRPNGPPQFQDFDFSLRSRMTFSGSWEFLASFCNTLSFYIKNDTKTVSFLRFRLAFAVLIVF